MTRIVTAGELLVGHSALDIECLDRIYLNAYVPVLQSSGQVVAFMTQHLGKPIPSPALMEQIGTRFRRSVESYADANGIPWVKFGKDDRKIAVMQPYIEAQAATGRRSPLAAARAPAASPRPPPGSCSPTSSTPCATGTSAARPPRQHELPARPGARPPGLVFPAAPRGRNGNVIGPARTFWIPTAPCPPASQAGAHPKG